MNAFCRQRRTSEITASALLCAAMCLPGAASAVEGGSGVYALGYIASKAGLSPEPGTYLSYNMYAYSGQSTTSVTLPIPLPNTSDAAQWNGKLRTDVDATVHLFSASRIFEEKLLGANIGFTVLVPHLKATLDLSGNGALTLPGSPAVPYALPGSGNYRHSSIGDIPVAGFLAWHDDDWHYVSLLNVYVPTGSYDKNRIVNLGKNHWAIEPIAAVTHLNRKTGLELSTAAGITFNQKNTATDYKSGTEFHIDGAAIQHFSAHFFVGLTGYAYQQLTADSGSGAASAYKGRVFAAGPIIGGAIPLGDKHTLYLNARYYKEFAVQNRFKGSNLYLSAAIKY
ncbi:MAG: transporter [Undibacterium sp.]|nr:transporter [Undibacterium sp.]